MVRACGVQSGFGELRDLYVGCVVPAIPMIVMPRWSCRERANNDRQEEPGVNARRLDVTTLAQHCACVV